MAATNTSARRVRRVTRRSPSLYRPIGSAHSAGSSVGPFGGRAAEDFNQPGDVDAGLADDAELIVRIFGAEVELDVERPGRSGWPSGSMARLSRHHVWLCWAVRWLCEARRDSGRSPILATEYSLPDVVADREVGHGAVVGDHGAGRRRDSKLRRKDDRPSVFQVFEGFPERKFSRGAEMRR